MQACADLKQRYHGEKLDGYAAVDYEKPGTFVVRFLRAYILADFYMLLQGVLGFFLRFIFKIQNQVNFYQITHVPLSKNPECRYTFLALSDLTIHFAFRTCF